MSRAYRLQVRENLRQVLRADDDVTSQLEMLPILPAGEMGELLGLALEARGFEKNGREVARHRDGITIEVNLDSLEVRVQSQAEQPIDLSAEREALVYDDLGPADKQQAAAKAKSELRKELARDAERHSAALRQRVADKLEGALADVRRDLDQAINRATAEALKKKAAQLGRIKEMTDDPASGSLTIVVEV